MLRGVFQDVGFVIVVFLNLFLRLDQLSDVYSGRISVRFEQVIQLGQHVI